MILPLVFPAVVAGSIFTFSLSLGDFITPDSSVSKTSSSATIIYDYFTDQPAAAAAFSLVPIVVMVVYLLIARRLGAFEHI